MKKFFTFCLMVSTLFSIDAMAACASNQRWCSFYANPGGKGCCIPVTEQCGPDSCPEISPITGCEGLPCENVGVWTNVNDGTNRQFVCNITDDECNYRCKKNYYAAEYRPAVVGSGDDSEIFSCVACPANATCEDQTAIGPNCNSGYYRHALLCKKPGSSGTGVMFWSYRTYECLPCPSGASCDGGSDKPVCDENTELMPLGGTEIPLCTDYRQSTTDSDGCGITYSCHACPTFIGMWPGETLLDTHLPGITGAPGSALVENSDGITSCYAIKGASVMDENGMFEVVYNYCEYQE